MLEMRDFHKQLVCARSSARPSTHTAVSHLTFTITPTGSCYHSQLADEETKAQRDR